MRDANGIDVRSLSDKYLIPNLIVSAITIVIAPIMLAVHRYVAASILIAITALLIIPASNALRHLQRMRKVKFIAVSSSSTRGVTYYDLLFQHIILQAHKSSNIGGGPTYVVFSWFARQRGSDDHHRALNAIPYKGVFIAPAPETNLTKELLDFPRGRVKIIVDALPADDSVDAHGFVGGNEELGGKLVAEVVVQHLKESGFSPDGPARDPQVLILLGHTFEFSEPQRHRVAREELEANHAVGHIHVVESEKLDYQREAARVYVYRRINEHRSNPRPDVIFATNDDMALGAREALRQLEEEGIDITTRTGSVPGIVGYDGIPEVVQLMNKSDERFLIATIDVKIEEQAERAWQLMKTHLSPRRGERHQSPKEKLKEKVEPFVVPRGHRDHESEPSIHQSK